MNNFVVVGLGGIGTVFVDLFFRYIANEEKFKDSTVTLIDGDDYEEKNIKRQSFNKYGRKADSKADELQRKYPSLKFISIPRFLNIENVSYLIPEGSTVFLCLDNHVTRKIVSDYCETALKDVIVINGGNELTDGCVQLYIKKGGKDVTPTITKYHDEIKYPSDKSPEEMSCEELSVSAPQVFFTNATAAVFMCNTWYSFIELKNKKVPSNVYFDILKCNVLAVERNA